MYSTLILDLVEENRPVASHRSTNGGSQMREDRVVRALFLEPTALSWDSQLPSLGPVVRGILDPWESGLKE